MQKKQETQHKQAAQSSYMAGKGIAGRLALTVLITVVCVLAIMVLCKLNMGEVPSVFGHELSFLF